MKHAVVVVSVVGILLSVVPGFAMDGDNGTNQFTALVGVQASAEMTDQELGGGRPGGTVPEHRPNWARQCGGPAEHQQE